VASTSSARSTPRARSHAELVAELAGRQKTVKGAPAYSRFVNRRMGRHLAAWAYRAGLTPNQVTALSAVCSGLAIAGLFAFAPSWLLGIAVAALFVLGYALDSADGQLSRLRGGGSPAGEWLDHMVDSAKICLLHLAVLVCLRRTDLDGRWLAVPAGYLVVNVLWFSGLLLTQFLREANRGTAPVVANASVVRSLIVLPTDFGVVCLVFLLLGAPRVFLAGYGLLGLANLLFLGASLVVWYRDLSGMGRAPAPAPTQPAQPTTGGVA